MAELKPCPFCNGEAEMRNPWMSSANFYVECYECGCTTAIFDTPEKAAEAWNKRADSPARHGRWIPHRIAFSSMCSECKKYAAFETPYCPHCGARMDGGTNND